MNKIFHHGQNVNTLWVTALLRKASSTTDTKIFPINLPTCGAETRQRSEAALWLTGTLKYSAARAVYYNNMRDMKCYFNLRVNI